MSLGRVLVVDDQHQVRVILSDMLRHLGYEVSGAERAENAIAAIVEVQPQVIFLDLQLPGISGLEALAYFRQHHPTVPVVVITGNSDDDITRQVRERGAFDVIIKPFSLTALKNVVARAITTTLPQ
jgi:DNA-binding NtrC family response regulator